MNSVSLRELSTQARVTVVDELAVAVRPLGAFGTLETVTTWTVEDVPRALVAVSVTAKIPIEANVWVGFWRVLTAVPSPKFQDQLVGTPEVASVKVTDKGATPVLALMAKAATGIAGTGGVTVIILVVAAEPNALDTSSETVNVPAALKVWLGFWTRLTGVASPKFQDQAVGTPVDTSVKPMVRGASPVVTVVMKAATGMAVTAAVTVTKCVIVDAGPVRLLTVSLTVKVPAVV
jgi:hypothetical protein